MNPFRATQSAKPAFAGGRLAVAAALCALVGASFLVLTGCIQVNNGVPAAVDVQKEIEQDLEPGASLDEIREYLDTRGSTLGIEHVGGEPTRATYYSRLVDEAGVAAETSIYVATIKGDLHGVDIYFILDDDYLLVRVIAFDAYTGL